MGHATSLVLLDVNLPPGLLRGRWGTVPAAAATAVIVFSVVCVRLIRGFVIVSTDHGGSKDADGGDLSGNFFFGPAAAADNTIHLLRLPCHFINVATRERTHDWHSGQSSGSGAVGGI